MANGSVIQKTIRIGSTEISKNSRYLEAEDKEGQRGL